MGKGASISFLRPPESRIAIDWSVTRFFFLSAVLIWSIFVGVWYVVYPSYIS